MRDFKLVSFHLSKKQSVKERDARAGPSRISIIRTNNKHFFLFYTPCPINKFYLKYRVAGKLVYDCVKKLSPVSSLHFAVLRSL